MTFGQSFRDARKQAGFTQQSLAAATNGAVSESLIANVETGRRLPSPDSLRAVIAALEGAGVEAGWLELQREVEKVETQFNRRRGAVRSDQEEPVSISSADGVDFDELKRLDPEGWEHVMNTARMLRDRARGNR